MRVQRADGGVASWLLLFTATPQSRLRFAGSPDREPFGARHKLGVQCRTPSRSDRFNGVTGGAGGPKGRNRNLPWPPCKKGYKVTHSYLFILNPSVTACAVPAPRQGSLLGCGTNSHIKPALKGDSSRARPVGDAARGESGGIGSIASGSEARRPYSNQRCGCECNEQTEGLHRGCCYLRQPLSLTSLDSSPAGEPFGARHKLSH